MSHLSGKTIGFLGAGQMAEAIFSGLLKSGAFAAEHIVISDVSAARLAQMQDKYGLRGILTSESDASPIRAMLDCDILVLAIKPQYARSALEQIAAWFTERHLIISIMGGVNLAFLQGFFQASPVVRVMPNAPMLAGAGVAGVAVGQGVTDAQAETALEIFRAVGTAYLLAEHLIDPLTSVSGCGPAYAYLFIEALADGGVEMGLPRELAYALAAQTLVGAGQMVLSTHQHPGKLKDDVCSPGGSTIAGVHALERGGFRGVVMSAVEAGKLRMEEIGRKA